MSDRTLLENAAKAAGIELRWHTFGSDTWCAKHPSGEVWNPLTDDGDAFRLAVKLGIEVVPFTGSKLTRAAFLGDVRQIEEPHGDDPYAATRRAIVRAAAAIGEKL